MSPDQPAALTGVDVGGTGIRVRVVRGEQSAERHRPVPVPRDRGRVDVRRVCDLVMTEVTAAMAELEMDRLTALGLGMTGIPGLVDQPADVDRYLRSRLEVGTVAVASDAVTTHLGALEGNAGTVVAAGTGIIALATDHDENWHQIDGWGILLGDEGSGAWIGRQGLQAALRSVDGRAGGSAGLATRLRDQFGAPIEFVGQLYSSASPAYELASFAPAVAAAARSGDPVAEEIWREAGRALGRTAAAGADVVPPTISWGGGLFTAADLLLEPFREAVLEVFPAAELYEPAGSSLDGAVHLARRAAVGVLVRRQPHLYVFPDPT